MVFLIGFALNLAACDSVEQQRQFDDEANQPANGITRTDAGGRIIVDNNGDVIEEDMDDWRTAPLHVGNIRFDPAYPNPSRGDLITLSFSVLHFNAIPGGLTLRGISNTNRFVLLDEVLDASQPGSYAFVFSPSLLSASGDITSIRGLHRLFVFDTTSELVTYGDVLIN
jgi:hypothetical protein